MGKLNGKIAARHRRAQRHRRGDRRPFAREGASIGVVDLDAAKAEQAAAAFARHGVRTAGVAADVGDEPAVNAAFGAIVAALGEIDILVNNAGIDTTARSRSCRPRCGTT